MTESRKWNWHVTPFTHTDILSMSTWETSWKSWHVLACGVRPSTCQGATQSCLQMHSRMSWTPIQVDLWDQLGMVSWEAIHPISSDTYAVSLSISHYGRWLATNLFDRGIPQLLMTRINNSWRRLERAKERFIIFSLIFLAWCFNIKYAPNLPSDTAALRGVCPVDRTMVQQKGELLIGLPELHRHMESQSQHRLLGMDSHSLLWRYMEIWDNLQWSILFHLFAVMGEAAKMFDKPEKQKEWLATALYSLD